MIKKFCDVCGKDAVDPPWGCQCIPILVNEDGEVKSEYKNVSSFEPRLASTLEFELTFEQPEFHLCKAHWEKTFSVMKEALIVKLNERREKNEDRNSVDKG